ncbi:MAG: chorismate synthase [Ruminococcaceae bacterium]|nr:chorismate synthase [Oscillospiraceae bacterium]
MKNTFGQSLCVTLFGESHGEAIGVVIDGLTPGIKIDELRIRHFLSLRRPSGKISTKRVEPDNFRIVSGVFDGYSTGTPLTIIIENTSTRSRDYEKTRYLMRPSHADYTAECKYHGFQDYRGGGHFSGRITAALVAAGAIIIDALKNKGIHIATHIKEIGGVSDRGFEDFVSDAEFLNNSEFPVLDSEKMSQMKEVISKVAQEGDSIGGILNTVVYNIPKGVGEPWFDSVESVLSHMMFSIPAVKGIEFGEGFNFKNITGKTANDPLRVQNGNIVTSKNANGGINGGITNGMPIDFSTVIKPTPSIYKEQDTVDISTNTNEKIQIEGRHDPAIIHRAAIVQTSVTAIAICDMLLSRFGTDWLK